ncbi:hypothetical protein WG66_000124 [Moniliophthora roreri]|nr:hypothetical protein WG66_000124 [Moniliophthora roreri]
MTWYNLGTWNIPQRSSLGRSSDITFMLFFLLLVMLDISFLHLHTIDIYATQTSTRQMFLPSAKEAWKTREDFQDPETWRVQVREPKMRGISVSVK